MILTWAIAGFFEGNRITSVTDLVPLVGCRINAIRAGNLKTKSMLGKVQAIKALNLLLGGLP